MTRSVLIALSLVLGASSAYAQRLAPSHSVSPTGRPAPREVARVNGTILLSDRLDAAVNALIPLESFHQTIGNGKLAEFRKQALKQLIDEELQYQDGIRLGVAIADRDVDAALTSMIERYGGRTRFDEALKRGGASMTSARREVKRTLVIGKTRERRVTAMCQVGDTEASQYYTQNPGRFVEPEQLHVFAITIGVDPSSSQQQWQAARARAGLIHEQLTLGASFDELARQHSTDATRTQGGDMGLFHRGSLTPQFEAVAKDLPVGRFSGVIETLYGYHIIRVSEIKPSRRMAFAEVHTRLKKDLTDTRCKEVSDAWISQLRSTATIVPAS